MLAGVGFVAALGLGIAARSFSVEIDPRIEKITELLPGANCGACGYPGCGGLASAIVSGKGEIVACSAVTGENAKEIAELMGAPYTEVTPRVAIVHCNHSEGGSKNKYSYIALYLTSFS